MSSMEDRAERGCCGDLKPLLPHARYKVKKLGMEFARTMCKGRNWATLSKLSSLEL